MVTAMTARPAGAADSGLYLKLDGGAAFSPGLNLDINGMPGHLSLDTGYRVDGTVGYWLSPWLAAELEGGFLRNPIETISLENMVGHPEGSSYLRQVPLLFNLVARYENRTAFTPYVGVGAGGVISDFRLSDNGDQETVVALQAKVGLIYKLEPQAWVDFTYQVLGTDNQNYRIAGVDFHTDKVLSHFLGVSVIWNF